MCFGEVVELELSSDPLFPNSICSHGYSIIKPLSNVEENISLIPHLAHFSDGVDESSCFWVLPKRAPPVCNQCQHIGHTMNACPDTLMKILKKKAENPQ